LIAQYVSLFQVLSSSIISTFGSPIHHIRLLSSIYNFFLLTRSDSQMFRQQILKYIPPCTNLQLLLSADFVKNNAWIDFPVSDLEVQQTDIEVLTSNFVKDHTWKNLTVLDVEHREIREELVNPGRVDNALACCHLWIGL
jgi:hypothetical protein